MIAVCSSWKWGFGFMSVAFLIMILIVSYVIPNLVRRGKL